MSAKTNTSNLNEEIQFIQVDKLGLYEIPTSPGSDPDDTLGWAGYILSGDDFPPEISLADSLKKYQGHYVFATTRPLVIDEDPESFYNELLDYINENGDNNRVGFWLESANPLKLGNFESFGFEFRVNITNPNRYDLVSNMNVVLGSNFTFFLNERLVLSVDESNATLNFTMITGTGIGFLNGTNPLGINIDNAAYVPFTGTSCACCVMNLNMKLSDTFGIDGLTEGFNYTVKIQTGVDNDNNPIFTNESLFYPTFQLDTLPSFINCLATVDPGDPNNTLITQSNLQKGYIRSAFIFQKQEPYLTNFSNPEGQLISLTPIVSNPEMTIPSPNSGGFVFSSLAEANESPGSGAVYFCLTGNFGISVNDVGAGMPQSMVGGLFGSERISFTTFNTDQPENSDYISFLPSQSAYAPVFPFEAATLNDPSSGGVVARLNNTYVTSHATIFKVVNSVEYFAEPEGSSMFSMHEDDIGVASDSPPVLPSAPPMLSLPQGLTNTFPIVPYKGITGSEENAQYYTGFESQIIAPTRKAVVSAGATETWELRKAQVSNFANIDPKYSTTPQGLIVKSDPTTGAYQSITMAISDYPKAFAFDYPTIQVQDALQSNQLFMVAVNDQYFNEANTTDPALSAVFENIVNIVGWTFTANVGKESSATNYRNVMIMKFCEGSLQDRVTNPNQWTNPEQFSLLEGTEKQNASLSFTGLSQWLQNYIADGIARADGPSASYYKNFKKIVTDPNWNGIIVLQAGLGADALPAEIKGLAAGIDFTNFVSHHFGFTVSRVQVNSDGVITIPSISSLFGLIDYEDPLFSANIASGIPPTTPVPVTTSDAFDFTVLSLKSLFENAKLVDFQSYIQLTVDSLFDSPTTRTYSQQTAMPANGVVLIGSYIDQGGTPSYVFQQDTPSIFNSASNLLPAVAFNRTQFNTLGPRTVDDSVIIANRFLIWGAFDFVQLDDTNGELLDVLSFGSPPDTPEAQLGIGLTFSNLIVNMDFPETTPAATSFSLDTANMAYDLNASKARPTSLFKGFGLELRSFINSSNEKTPADFGYLPVTSTLNLEQINNPWFGVVYQVTLGGPGALASAVGFTSNLLLAWSPATTTGASNYSLFIGLSLPGASPGASMFSLQGVFKVAVGSIAILRQVVPNEDNLKLDEPEQYYCLRMDDIGIKIFGIVKLPPDANIQFFLFGDPNSTGSLGWYAAYVAEDNPDCKEDEFTFEKVDENLALDSKTLKYSKS